MSKLKFIITFFLIIALFPSISCQKDIEVSRFILSRENSEQTDIFYMDDKSIDCTIEFLEIIRDSTLDIRCVFVTGDENIPPNTVVAQVSNRLVNKNRWNISLYRTGSYWSRGSYFISLLQKGKEITRVPFQVTSPLKPILTIEKTGPLSSNLRDKITKYYSWEYKGEIFQYEFKVSKSLYDYYANKPRFSMRDPSDYVIYVTEPYDNSFVNGLTDEFLRISTELGFDQFERLGLIVSFIQSLPYVDDRIAYGYENPKYPIETLVDEGGDCEDTSILLSSILDAMDIMNVLLIFPTHCAVGVGASGLQGKFYRYEGIDYYYLESTNPRWTLGRVPEDLASITPNITPLTTKPVIVHDYEYSELGKVIKLSVEVFNLGSVNSGYVEVIAGFETENPDFNYHQRTEPFRLNIDESANIIFYLDFPFMSENLMFIKTFHDGELSYYSDEYWYKKSISSN